MGQFLQRFLVAWEIGWEENKVKLIQQADFDSIVNLNSVKVKVQNWCNGSSDSDDAAAPTEAEVFRELQKLPEYCRDWSALKDALSSANLTFEELSQAGTQQQNLHFLHAFPLALKDGSKNDD